VVYRARDTHLQRDVALKISSPGLVAKRESRNRFRHEGLTLSKLYHPSIAIAFDSG